MFAPQLLTVLLTLHLAGAFEYKNADQWHKAEDHDGLIDLSGIEEVRVSAKNDNFRCKNGVRSMASWITGAHSCESLVRDAVQLTCVAQKTQESLLQKLTMHCSIVNDEDNNRMFYMLIKLELNCRGNRFPTDYVKQAKTCIFKAYLDTAHTLAVELVLHVTALLASLITLFKSRRYKRSSIIVHSLLYGAYIPLLLISYVTRSVIVCLLVLSVWTFCTLYYCAHCYYKEN